MLPQLYEWTCSVCSATWVLQSIGIIDPNIDQYAARDEVAQRMGVPNCVNPTYGCMSTQCVKDLFESYGLYSQSAYVTFDQAYAIMSHTTGTINPQGMYHFMAIRGVDGGNLWVANSAPGYRGVYDALSRSQFNSLGPVELVYIVP
jgi:hypothetical protein